jgi:hypothetical protein
MTLNANVAPGGQIRLEVLANDGAALPGFGAGYCAPVVENSLAGPIHCVGSFQSLANQPVWFQFELTNAQLYAFHLEP